MNGDDSDPDPDAHDECSGDDTLAVDADDLAGVVDLFGALTRAELDRALDELAFKRRVDPPEGVVDDAVASYHLVDHDGLLVAGPTAFPTLPEGAADLPHILDVDREAPPTEAVAETVERRFRAEAARTLAGGSADVDAGDGDDTADADEGNGADVTGGARGPAADPVERLVDVSYDLEAWGPVDVGGVRRRLDDARDDGG
jgi:hypothetical protein